MKKLYYSESTGQSIVIHDENNYAIGKIKPNTQGKDELHGASYFTSMLHALKEMARREADATCSESIVSWIKEIRTRLDNFKQMFDVAVGQ